ncbi:MAG: hypothetical protein I3273_00135 [Candidatus Moeniiplasma glomeromycotorum]|nr:hypothetical protein [Candidatus Moeniiplasma glomeromycotorum]MCE8167462.1 hypothetical protein [Candidatus Moeniiplasma glomeromycotorum]MCE8168524.1 hypothetical protein [Candidatus Moeniiplasma glomeromycotorum]
MKYNTRSRIRQVRKNINKGFEKLRDLKIESEVYSSKWGSFRKKGLPVGTSLSEENIMNFYLLSHQSRERERRELEIFWEDKVFTARICCQ